jgi:hypothetical protein
VQFKLFTQTACPEAVLELKIQLSSLEKLMRHGTLLWDANWFRGIVVSTHDASCPPLMDLVKVGQLRWDEGEHAILLGVSGRGSSSGRSGRGNKGTRALAIRPIVDQL